MTLRKRTFIISILTLAGLIGILYVTSSTILLGSFAHLERDKTEENLDRVQRAIANQLSMINMTTRDWSNWDDTYNFVRDGNPLFIEDNLYESTFVSLGLNIMLFVDSSGKVIYGYSLETEELGQELEPIPDELLAHVKPGDPLLDYPAGTGSITGFILLPDHPLLLASREILRSDGQGPSSGTLIFGRYLSPDRVESLGELTGLSITTERPDAGRLPDDFEVAYQSLSGGEGSFVQPLSANRIAGYALLEDIYGQPALMFRVDKAQDIYQQGRSSVTYFMLFLGISGVLLGLLNLLFLDRSILARLADLSSSISYIGGQPDLSARIDVRGRDELSSVAQSINSMLAAREQSQEQLAQSRENYRELVQNANSIILRLDTRGKISFFNEFAQQFFGYDKSDILGHDAVGTIIPDSGAARENLREMIENIGTHPEQYAANEYENQCRDGRRMWISWANKAIYSPEGAVAGILAVGQDISARKQAEKDLQIAKEAAEAASQAKSIFLANMSHEIRTPMNGIIGMTELTMDTNLTPVQRDYLTAVQVSAESLLGLLNNILDFSKIEAGRLELEDVPFDLNEIIEQVAKMMSQRATAKGLELLFDVSPDIETRLNGDSLRIRQVLVNLVGNAIKFTEKGEVIVRVAKVQDWDDSTTLVFSVTDTGSGILPDKLGMIFDSFSQVDPSVTRRHGGTGLGLAICKELVQMMGGELSVKSEIGHGSTFSFTAQFRYQPKFRDDLPETDRVSLLDCRVLVIDDNETNRRILHDGLASWGCQSNEVRSGEEGLEALQQALHEGHLFDLVLLDVQMPGMSGLDMLRIIRKTPEMVSLPVIMLTSLDGLQNVMDRKDLNWSAYITKPVKQSVLFDTIIQVLNKTMTVRPASVETELPIRPETDQPLRILLAEDNPINQRLAKILLEKMGHSVTEAETGRQALALLENSQFDLIFMDIQMPEMDGFEATSAIRDNPAWAHLPIIAMTAHALKGDQERCLAAGMDDYVSKPIHQQDLREAIKRQLNRKRGAAIIPPAP